MDFKLTKAYYRNKFTEKVSQTTGEISLDRDFIEVQSEQFPELSTFSYVNGGIDFFLKYSRLARGLTLSDNDEVVLVGFEKFFLMNQLENYQTYTDAFKEQYARLQEQDSYQAYEKLDGTLIIVGIYKDEIVVSTTSSMNSYHAKSAQTYFNQLKNKEEIKAYLKNNNVCLIFEFVSKTNLIAVRYNHADEYVLLAQVDKQTFNREYIQDGRLGFRNPKVVEIKHEDLTNIRNMKDIEGFVVVNNYGNLIKLKTTWWFEESYKNNVFFKSTLNKERVITDRDIETILKAIKNDSLDEFYAIQNSNPVLQEQDKVGKIEKVFRDLETNANILASKYTTSSELAIAEKGNEYLTFAFAVKRKGSIWAAGTAIKRHIKQKLKEATENA